MQLLGVPVAPLPAGNEVGMLGVPVQEGSPAAGGLPPDQLQSMLSRARPPSGTVRLSASYWIRPSTLPLAAVVTGHE